MPLPGPGGGGFQPTAAAAAGQPPGGRQNPARKVLGSARARSLSSRRTFAAGGDLTVCQPPSLKGAAGMPIAKLLASQLVACRTAGGAWSAALAYIEGRSARLFERERRQTYQTIRWRMASSGVHIASAQRCRGAGNMAENDSWKPGSMLPRYRPPPARRSRSPGNRRIRQGPCAGSFLGRLGALASAAVRGCSPRLSPS